MRTFSLIAVVVAVAAIGCKSEDEPSGDESTPAATEKPEPPADATPDEAEPGDVFDGPLTVERLQSAKGLVRPFDPWEEAYGKLLAKLGEPVSVDGADRQWGILTGDTCHYLIVEKGDDKVGTVMGPAKVDKVLKSQYVKCAAAAGIGAPPPAPKDAGAVQDAQ